jgi:diguanylate cyclase (GGDEF)-like protein
MSEIPRKAAGKEQEITDADVAVTSKEDVLTARPMLENVPFPVMGISAGHEIVWMNAAGLKAYGAAQGQCYAVSHGYDSPCNLHGEPCPKILAEQQGKSISVLHVHQTASGQERFKVVAIPIDGGGVVEWHIPLDDISAIDSVTGLLTRTEAEQAARRMFALMARMKSSFAVVMVDIDHFKQVNDQYGHLAGDKVLERVSRLITLELRESDVLGRWGGEEFLILLSDIDRATAISVAERILNVVRTHIISIDAENLAITISAGLRWVAGLEAPAQNFDAIVRDADRSLYRAKNDGRDRCIVYAKD